MKLLLILILFLTACSSRQVQKSKTNQLKEVKSDVSIKTESKFNNSVVDQSKVKTTAVDKSKVFETDHTTISADEAEYDQKTGKLNFKGNVRLDHKGQKQTTNDKHVEVDQVKDFKAATESKNTSDSSSKQSALNQQATLNKDSKSQGLAFNKWWFWVILPIILFGGFKIYRAWK